jgi:hypothetical protein
MFLWYPVMDLARAPRRTARKKGSGYENGGDRVAGTRSRRLLLGRVVAARQIYRLEIAWARGCSNPSRYVLAKQV